MADKRIRIEFNPHLGITVEQCLKDNYKLVHKVCQRYINAGRSVGVEYEDIVSLANIGLMKAYNWFDPTAFSGMDGQPVRFSTYAVPMMMGEIRKFFRDHHAGPKFTRSAKEVGFKISKMNEEQDGFDSLPVEEIAKILEVSVERVKNGLAYMRNITSDSLSSVVFENDGDSITLEDQVPVHDDQSDMFVDDFLNQLPQQYRTIVEMRMRYATQKEIGNALGISQVQVSRLQEKIGELLNKYRDGGEIKVTKKKFDDAKLKWMLENKVDKLDVMKALDISNPTYYNYKKKFELSLLKASLFLKKNLK